MNYFRSVLGGQQGDQVPGTEGADIVEKLVDRLDSSTLIEDRRDACRALKAMSKKHRVDVGAQGMDTLIRVLRNDGSDQELVGYALDTLCVITSRDPMDNEVLEGTSQLGEQFTEIFIKQPEHVSLVLNFLEEFDYRVRWPAVKLLINLLANKSKDIQDIVLVSPMGVSKLMDLLGDSREVIRNDVLLLLIQLTKGNANIQKIVAFENAFDRIFDVIKDEGLADGGIVVQDCLLLMLNLLRNNISNINFFKEGSYIQRLTSMFSFNNEDDSGEDHDDWTPQRVANIHCMLQVIRALASPSNPNQVTSSCQKLLKTSGVLEALCDILMASGVPADVLTETINTVAEVIRGNFSNQEFFSGVMAPSNPPRSAIVILLMSMVNEKQPFMLRCAVLYCFQCYLFKNEFGQAQLLQTLLPQSASVPTLTSGQLLCGGLFSSDQLSNWFSAVALCHGICDNPLQKEQLLKVLLATTSGAAPVSLLHQCSLLLQQTNRLQAKLGLLMLLCVWLSHCPLAVANFLAMPSNIPFLTSQAGSNEHDDNEELVQGLCTFLMGICVHFNDNSVPNFSKENLCQIITKRIGIDVFVDKLSEVSRHEVYSKTAKHPQIRPHSPAELLLDHEFCRLFKALEGLVGKSVSPKEEVPNSVLVLQYKEIIREQDAEMAGLKEECARLKKVETELKARLVEASEELRRSQDETLLLRACSRDADSTVQKIQSLEKAITEKDAQIDELLRTVNSLNIEKLNNEVTFHDDGKNAEVSKEFEQTKIEYEKLKRDQENLLELLMDQDSKIASLKMRLRALGENVEDDDDADTTSSELRGT